MTPMQQDQQNQPKPVAAEAALPPGKAPTNPRLSGALMSGGGVLLLGFNGWMLADSNTFYPKLLIIGAALIPFGFWTLVTGIAYDKNNPVKPPGWWTAGAILLTMAGLIAGIAATVFISE